MTLLSKSIFIICRHSFAIPWRNKSYFMSKQPIYSTFNTIMLKNAGAPQTPAFPFTFYLLYEIAELHSHLLSNFLSEVLLFLLQALAGLETNELLDGDVGVVGLRYGRNVSGYALLAVLCLYVYLI